MVTIHHVDIQFEVEGEDERLFKKHFDQAIAQWWSAQKECQHREKQGREDASLFPPRRE